MATTCLPLAPTPPRWVFNRWKRGHQTRFIDQTARRDPEARGDRAPDDVFDAACRSVGGALTFVAIYEKGEGRDRALVIRASSAPSVAGTIPSEGLIARALDDGRAFRLGDERSRHDFVQNAAVHVGEPEIAAGVAIGEALVVEA